MQHLSIEHLNNYVIMKSCVYIVPNFSVKDSLSPMGKEEEEKGRRRKRMRGRGEKEEERRKRRKGKRRREKEEEGKRLFIF